MIFLAYKKLFCRELFKLQHNSKYIVLAHDKELSALYLDFYAAVLTEEDLVALFHVYWVNRSVLTNLALANGNDTSALRALLCIVWKEKSASGFFLRSQTLNDDTVL
jgi:hypothetical protein